MILVIESVVLCLAFTGMVYLMSRDPIKTLYNYPPKIQEKVKSLPEYRDKIPTEKNKVVAKCFACVLIVVVISLVLRFINGYTTFLEGFGFHAKRHFLFVVGFAIFVFSLQVFLGRTTTTTVST